MNKHVINDANRIADTKSSYKLFLVVAVLAGLIFVLLGKTAVQTGEVRESTQSPRVLSAAVKREQKDRQANRPMIVPDTGVLDRTLAKLLGMPREFVEREAPTVDFSLPLKTLLSDLKDRVRSGDGKAALTIGIGLAECAQSPRSNKELDERISNLYRTRRRAGYAAQVEDLEYQESILGKRATFCKDITHEQVLDHFSYMRIAADDGELYAQSRLFLAILLEEDARKDAYTKTWRTKEKMQTDRYFYLRQAADKGEIQAIFMLAGDPNLSAVDSTAYRLAGLNLQIQSGAEPKAVFEEQIRKIRMSESHAIFGAAAAKARTIVEGESCCSVFRKTMEITNE